MRVLFSCSPGIGHLYPLLPLAREFRDQGHDVAFLASGGLAAAVAGEEFDFLTAGPGIEVLLPEAFRRYPDLAALPAEEAMRAGIPVFGEVRLDLTVPEALPAARGWRPDLIVSEHADFVGPLLAALLDIRHATLGFGPGHPADWLELAGRSVASSYEHLGLRPPASAGLYDGTYLDTCPPALQQPRFRLPAAAQPLRPEAYSRPGTRWSAPGFAGHASAPLVLLTMGTIFGSPAVFTTAVHALTELDVNILVTVGPLGDPAAIKADASRVHVERFIPLDLVLPACDLVVTHGGAGITLASLAAGIPMVMIPQSADQFINAERAVAAGAAVSVPPSALDTRHLGDAADRVLHERGFTAAAARIQHQIARMPDPAYVAKTLACD